VWTATNAGREPIRVSASQVARKLVSPVALVLASLAASAVLLELCLRALGLEPMEGLSEGRGAMLRESDHPLRMFELVPNSRGVAWRTRVEINSYGMRDRERPRERTGAPRVLVLGDSVTFGSGVAPRDRFTDQLEPLLAERLGESVEVLNFGVGGYDTLQEIATLEHLGLDFAPDLVVLAYCLNDTVDNSPNLEYIRSLRELESPVYRLRSAQLIRSALDRLRLMRRLELDNRDADFARRFDGLIAPVTGDLELMALREELRAVIEQADDPEALLEWYVSDVHLGRVTFALGQLARFASHGGFAVVVAILPYLGEAAGWEVVYRMVAHMSTANGLPAVVLAPALGEADLASLRLRSRDAIHPNARGHRLIAEALAPHLGARLVDRAPAAEAAPTGSREHPRQWVRTR
jgi:lysophospholipase L1-like esterase